MVCQRISCWGQKFWQQCLLEKNDSCLVYSVNFRIIIYSTYKLLYNPGLFLCQQFYPKTDKKFFVQEEDLRSVFLLCLARKDVSEPISAQIGSSFEANMSKQIVWMTSFKFGFLYDQSLIQCCLHLFLGLKCAIIVIAHQYYEHLQQWYACRHSYSKTPSQYLSLREKVQIVLCLYLDYYCL